MGSNWLQDWDQIRIHITTLGSRSDLDLSGPIFVDPDLKKGSGQGVGSITIPLYHRHNQKLILHPLFIFTQKIGLVTSSPRPAIMKITMMIGLMVFKWCWRRCKFGFLDGTITQPRPLYTTQNWSTIYAMLVSWLVNTIIPEVESSIFQYRDAQKSWDTLKSCMLSSTDHTFNNYFLPLLSGRISHYVRCGILCQTQFQLVGRNSITMNPSSSAVHAVWSVLPHPNTKLASKQVC